MNQIPWVDIDFESYVKMEARNKAAKQGSMDGPGEMVVHNMIHQPYAIKSKLSEKKSSNQRNIGDSNSRNRD